MKQTIYNAFTNHPNLHWILVLLVIVVTLTLSGCNKDSAGNEIGTKEYVERRFVNEVLPKGSVILSVTNIGNYHYDYSEVFVKFYFENECFMINGNNKWDSGITKVDCP